MKSGTAELPCRRNYVLDYPCWATFCFTSLFAFVVYAASLPPHVTLGMGGIYSTGAYYAGVPHPPGYPAWTVYAHIFTVLIPVGNVAWRVALSSAVAGALATGLIASSICHMGSAVFESRNCIRALPNGDKQALRIVCGFVGASAFAFSDSFWKMAIAPEPHVFGLLLLAASCFMLQRWFFAPERFGFLVMAATAFGAVVMNSQYLFAATPGLLIVVAVRNPPLGRDLGLAVAVLLLGATLGNPRGWWVPAPIAYLTQLHDLWAEYLVAGLGLGLMSVILSIHLRKCLSERWKVLALLIAFAIPFLAYFYSAVASMTNPPANWAYARGTEGFVHLIGRGQYERIMPAYSLHDYSRQLGMFVPVFLKAYGWLFLIPAVLCLVWLRKLDAFVRRWLLALAAAFACMTFLLLAMLNPPAREDPTYLLAFAAPAYILLAFWTGCGLMLAGQRLAGRKNPTA